VTLSGGTIPDAEENANTTSFALDGLGVPHISYLDNSVGGLTVRKFEADSWVVVGSQGFSDGSLQSVTLQFDAGGRLYAGYTNDSGFNIAWFNGFDWQKTNYTDAPTDAGAFVVDQAGRPFMMYSNWFYIMIAEFGDNSWTTNHFFTADIGTYRNRLTLSPSGTLYASHRNEGSLSIFQATASHWTSVGPADTNGDASFQSGDYNAGDDELHEMATAVDGADTPYVAYINAREDNKTSVKKFDGSTWATVGAAGFSSTSATALRIAIGPDNVPYVAYQDTSSRLMVRKFDGSAWATVGAAVFTSASSVASLAVGPDNVPYVAYNDT
jgi:hypothetical protein